MGQRTPEIHGTAEFLISQHVKRRQLIGYRLELVLGYPSHRVRELDLREESTAALARPTRQDADACRIVDQMDAFRFEHLLANESGQESEYRTYGENSPRRMESRSYTVASGAANPID